MEYDTASPRDKERFEVGASTLVKLAWEYLVSLRIAKVVDNREVDYNTATGFLMRQSGKHLIGTAWHVHDEFAKRKASGEDLYFLANDVPLEPIRVVWADEASDVVLLAVSDADVPKIGVLAYEPGEYRWPPRRVTSDDVVFFCGFPKCLRSDDTPEIEFRDAALLLPVTHVSDNHFVLHLNRENIIDAGRAPFPYPNDETDAHLGGISGSPVFAMDDLSYPLVGIISNMGTTLINVGSLADAPAEF